MHLLATLSRPEHDGTLGSLGFCRCEALTLLLDWLDSIFHLTDEGILLFYFLAALHDGRRGS